MTDELKPCPTINGIEMPKRIWLTDEGSGDICWANEPDPSGDGQAEAVEYVRADTRSTSLSGEALVERLIDEKRRADPEFDARCRTVMDAIASSDTTLITDAWQPIETAPRDGSSLLFALPGMNAASSGRWSQELNGWEILFAWRGIEPTHWMPLRPPALSNQPGERG